MPNELEELEAELEAEPGTATIVTTMLLSAILDDGPIDSP